MYPGTSYVTCRSGWHKHQNISCITGLLVVYKQTAAEMTLWHFTVRSKIQSVVTLRMCLAPWRRQMTQKWAIIVYSLKGPLEVLDNSAFSGQHFCSGVTILFILSHCYTAEYFQSWMHGVCRCIIVPQVRMDSFCKRDIKIGIDAVSFLNHSKCFKCMFQMNVQQSDPNPVCIYLL